MPINETLGHVVAGVVLDDKRFLGRMLSAQLLAAATDPRDTEDAKKRDEDANLADIYEIRKEVQRLFDGAKRRNVDSYATYLVSLNDGGPGMAPPVILYSRQPLEVEHDESGAGRILLPYRNQLVAIDGETQLAARFEAKRRDSRTLEQYVPVLICHGQPKEWARQVFHDLNLLAVRPNAAVGLSMDERDPVTYIARRVEDGVPLFKGRVHFARRQLRANDKEIVTITALRGACVTFAEGIGGVKYGARPVHVPAERVEPLVKVALEWFGAVADAIGPSLEDRDGCLASAPPVLASIGAMGHGLSQIVDPAIRRREVDRLLGQLRRVRWQRSQAWEGIAGKFNPRGQFSVGGTKETAYAVYHALSDSSNAGYDRIRALQATPATA